MKVQYKPKRNLIETIFQVEILKGMALTLRKMFSPAITRQYPLEGPPIFPGFRGQHALVRDPVTRGSKCVACMRCATVCPSRCIKVNYDEDESHKRVVKEYTINALRCVFCGFCVEVCPVGAVTMTEVFEYATYDRKTAYFDEGMLLANWDRFLAGSGHGEGYVNPFWRIRGVAESTLPAQKRLKVPDDWTLEKQYVGPKSQVDPKSQAGTLNGGSGS
jgi:NADH-quinone oxidoreductase subunit I